MLFLSGDKTTPAIDKTDIAVSVTDCLLNSCAKENKQNQKATEK
jgi:hypothetical protein